MQLFWIRHDRFKCSLLLAELVITINRYKLATCGQSISSYIYRQLKKLQSFKTNKNCWIFSFFFKYNSTIFLLSHFIYPTKKCIKSAPYLH